MNRLRFLSFTAAAASVALLASSADAGWGSRGSYGSYGSSYGSYGSSGYSAAYASGGSSGYASYSSYASHGSSGGSYGSSYASYDSSGGSHGTRVGPLRRLVQRIHARRAARHSQHSSGGSSGYSSYYGGGSSGYSSYGSGGSSGYSSYYGGGSSGYGSSGGSVPYYSAGVSRPARTSYMASSDEATSDESSLAGEPAEVQVAADTALLTISVPESARVIVNGHQTTSTGPIRQFMSKGLKSGYTYTYNIEVQNDIDGRTVSDHQSVTVRAGQAERLAFSPPATDRVETAVTVHVPADAEVTLAGNPTDATGPTRTFRTQQLKAGETWNDYSVQVAVMRDGRRVVEEKSISLRGGSEHALDFEFDSPADAVVAAR